MYANRKVDNATLVVKTVIMETSVAHLVSMVNSAIYNALNIVSHARPSPSVRSVRRVILV